MDHDHYGYSNLFERAPIAWPSGKGVAVTIVVNLEWFPILPEDKPFRAPGHMVTPYPDYRHYTSREYGTRVGFRSEEHTSELQSLMRISYAVFCLKKKKQTNK